MIRLINLEGFSDPSHFPLSCLYAQTLMPWGYANDNPLNCNLPSAPNTYRFVIFRAWNTFFWRSSVFWSCPIPSLRWTKRPENFCSSVTTTTAQGRYDASRCIVLSTTFVILLQKGFWESFTNVKTYGGIRAVLKLLVSIIFES